MPPRRARPMSQGLPRYHSTRHNRRLEITNAIPDCRHAHGRALIAAGTAVGAQTCVGYAPFANGPARVSGDLSIANHATTYGAGIVFGNSTPPVFGGVSISGTSRTTVPRKTSVSAGSASPSLRCPRRRFAPSVSSCTAGDRTSRAPTSHRTRSPSAARSGIRSRRVPR